MIEPGNDRSRSVNTAMPPGSSSAGPHHASSIRAVAAPTAIPARIPSPESVGAAMLQVALTGCGWYCWRMSSLRAKPPAASSTPRLAPMRSWRPPRSATTPTTRSSRTISSTRGHSSQTSVGCVRLRWSSWPTRDAPPVSGACRNSVRPNRRTQRTFTSVRNPLTVRLAKPRPGISRL